MNNLGQVLFWYPILENVLLHLHYNDRLKFNIINKELFDLKKYLVTSLTFQYIHTLTPQRLQHLLNKYPNLNRLQISHVSYPILYVIGQYKNIRHLKICIYGIFNFYTDLVPQLTHLDLSKSIYLNNILYQLKDFNNLKWINISNNQYIEQDELENLLFDLINIEEIIFQNCHKRYNKHVFDNVQYLKKLKVLNICGSHFTYQMKKHLEFINNKRLGLGMLKCNIII